MSEYKHGNWFCKPASQTEAREIIERAEESGAANRRGWSGNGTAYRCYGVKNGLVFYGSKREWVDATEYTIEQLREKFPLPGKLTNTGWEGESQPPVGWYGECSPDEIKWYECMVLPDGFIAYSYTLYEKKYWGVDEIDGLIFRPICGERNRWIESAAVSAHKDAVLTPEQCSYAASVIYDAIKSGDLKAPEVDND